MADSALRACAFVLGAACAILIARATYGGALVVLVVIGAAFVIQRKRGRPLTRLQAYITAVATCGTLVLVGGGILLLHHSPDGQTRWQELHTAMQQAATERARHPRPPPAFLRNLPGGGQPPAPMLNSTPFQVLSMIIGGELLGIVFGTLTWAAGWLVLYGLMGSAQTRQ